MVTPVAGSVRKEKTQIARVHSWPQVRVNTRTLCTTRKGCGTPSYSRSAIVSGENSWIPCATRLIFWPKVDRQEFGDLRLGRPP
jgi:hypothetical protein